MPHQDKSQKCYLVLGINLEWRNGWQSSYQKLIWNLPTLLQVRSNMRPLIYSSYGLENGDGN